MIATHLGVRGVLGAGLFAAAIVAVAFSTVSAAAADGILPDCPDVFTDPNQMALCGGRFEFTEDSESEAVIAAGISHFGLRDPVERLSGGDSSSVGDFGAALADVDHGWEYNRQGKYDAALMNCDAALRLAPKLGGAFLCLGWTHLALGDAAAALADFDRMAKLHPAWWTPREGRAQSLLALARFNEAAASLRDDFPVTASVAMGDERAIAVLWMLTAVRRSGGSDQEAAAIAGQTVDFDTWPGPIAGYLLRQRTEEGVEAAASVAVSFSKAAPSPACRTAFFLAEGNLADGFIDAARARLQHSKAICPVNSGERIMAGIELKRLRP